MSQILSNFEIASLVGAEVFKKDGGDVVVHTLSDSLAQLNGLTPYRMRATIYILTDEEMTEVRVSFLGHQGLSFEFKIFSNEATEERVQRYVKHYLAKHENYLDMMAAKR